MKNNPYWMMTMLVMITLLLSCCDQLESITPTMMPSKTATVTPTVSQTPTVTKTPTAIMSFTPFPKLKPEEEEVVILGLLKANGGCDLPCWWGLKPGITNEQEAMQLLSELKIYAKNYTPRNVSGAIWKGYSNSYILKFSDGFLDQEMDFKLDQEILRSIELDSIFLSSNIGARPSPSFLNALSAYAPERIIPMLGIPSQVKIDPPDFLPGEGATTHVSFMIYVLYDQKGIQLTYFVRNKIEEKSKICLTSKREGDMNDSINILLTSPNDLELIDNIDAPGLINRALPIESAAGITPEDFYNLYLPTQKSVCFNVLSSIFPSP